MYSKAFKIYLFIIFLVLAFLNPFYISFAYTNYSGAFDRTQPSHSQHSSASFDFEYTDPMSFELWAWFNTGTTGHQVLISKVGEDATHKGYSFYAHNTGTDYDLAFQFINTLTSNMLGCKTTPNANYAYDEWNHFVATYDGTGLCSGVNIYVNGDDIALTTVWETISATILTDADFKLGIGQSDTEPFDGKLDEVRIWDVELSEYQVDELWASGDGTFDLPNNCNETDLVATFRFDENSGAYILDYTNSNDGDNSFITWTTGKVTSPPDVVTFSFATSTTDILVGSAFDVEYHATSTTSIIQACGLWSPWDVEWLWQEGPFENTCDFSEEISGAYVGENIFVGAVTVDFQTYYSDDFIVTGYVDEDLPPFSSSDIPTINFTTANSTTTIGVENIFHIDGYDDVQVVGVYIWNPEISEMVAFNATSTTDTLEVEYSWTPKTAGVFWFLAEVWDNHGQVGYPTSTPGYIEIQVFEDIEDEITIPVISDVPEPDSHFLIDSAQTLISFLHLDDIWNWFVSLFKQKFPFSWFYAIFNIWDIERDTIKDLSAESALTVSWTFPTSTPAFAGSTFNLFDLETARTTYSSFFALIRIILINIFWLGFAFLLIGKVKKFINDMSIND